MISDKFLLLATGTLGQILRIVTFLIMARSISDADYGIWQLLLASSAILSLGDFLLPSSVVQIRDLPEKQVVDSAYLLGWLLYGVYGVMTLAAGWILADRQDNPVYWYVSLIWAGTQFLTITNTIQLAVINRQRRFSAEAWITSVISLLVAASGITFALLGWGVYALALQLFISQLFGVLLTTFYCGLPWPSAASLPAFKRLISQGFKATLTNWSSNLQNASITWIIKSIGGEALVGIWGRAIGILQMFSQNLIARFERISFTTLCAAADDTARFKDLTGQVLLVMLTVTSFTGAWMWAGSENLILSTIGPSWESVIPLLEILAFAVPAGALYAVGYGVLFAKGRLGLTAVFTFVDLLTYVPLAWIFSHWGIEGVAWAWTISRVSIGLIYMAGACRISGYQPVLQLAESFWLLVFGAFSAVAMLILQPRLLGQLYDLTGITGSSFTELLLTRGISLGISSCIALAAFVCLLRLITPGLFGRFISLIRKPKRA